MARKLPPKEQEEQEQGSPEWMVTFSDCMTLLLTFFVLLLTFSSISDKDFNRAAMEFQAGMPSIVSVSQSDRESFMEWLRILMRKPPEKGSSIPVEESGPDDDSTGPETEIPPDSIGHRKIFLLESRRLFIARSHRLRSSEEDILVTMGEYINRVQARIVISENGPPDERGTGLGLPRALAAKDFLVRECGVDGERISVSIRGTADPAVYSGQRRLEIALLERGIHR